MSSNKTTYLKLNQWRADDPVLRDDFNADNSRLDAAVNSRSLLRMAGGTVSSSRSSITIDLGTYDLLQFREIQLLCGPLVTRGSYSGTQGGPNLRLALNGSSKQATLQRLNAAENTRQGVAVHIMLTPAGPCGYVLSTGGTMTALSITDVVDYGDGLSLTLSLSDNATFGAGTWYGVYGIKL